jgi:hypothetical protein
MIACCTLHSRIVGKELRERGSARFWKTASVIMYTDLKYIVACKVVRSMDQEVSHKFQTVNEVYENPGCLNTEHVSGITG